MTATKTRKPPAPLRKPATLDHLRKARTVSQVVSLCTEDIPEPERLKAGASELERKAYERAVEDYNAAVEAATVEMVITSLPRKTYRDLLDAHQPSETQIKEAKDAGEPRPTNDGDPFAVALLHASITEPEGVTDEDAQHIVDNWPAGEVAGYGGIVSRCIALNESSRLEYHQGKSGGTRG